MYSLSLTYVFILLYDLDDENNEIDGTGWLYKPTKNWCQEETINWLMTAASTIGQPYSLIQHSLAVPGNELITFTKDDFKAHDPTYGDKLYDLLPPQHICTYTYLMYIIIKRILIIKILNTYKHQIILIINYIYEILLFSLYFNYLFGKH